MEINHFFPDQRIPFFRNIDKVLAQLLEGEKYQNFQNNQMFLEKLNERINKLDISLITAHGQYNAVIDLVRFDKPKKLIELSDTNKFKNNFIFSFSCNTADRLGEKMIEDGAITFIGFYHGFSPNFNIDGLRGRQFKLEMELFGKKIFVYAFIRVFSHFIKKPVTAQEFYEMLLLSILKVLDKVKESDVDDILSKFQVPINRKEYLRHKKLIFQSLSDIFIKAFDSIDILGEVNYIPWKNLSALNSEKLEEILISYEMEFEDNKFYEYLVKYRAATILGKKSEADEYLEKLKVENIERKVITEEYLEF